MSVHGGDVWQAGEEFGIPAAELLDFSANINPRGLPPRARQRLARDASDRDLLKLYPDPDARHLRRALSQRFDVPVDSIAIGPGAEALLGPALRCLQVRRIVVPVPAFSEYRRVCAQAEIEFTPLPLSREDSFRLPVASLASSAALLLNNPHNPSGSCLDRAVVLPLIEPGRALLVDEAFVDYVPQASVVREAATSPGLVVIRSLTKFYGCPALRVGYAVAPPETIRRLRSLLPTWPVTQLALDALTEAVADIPYSNETLRETTLAREQVSTSLRALGLAVFPSAANFLLLELTADMPAAAELRARLIRNHRILVRNCDSYEGLAPGRYIRVAVRTAAENLRLVQALKNP